MSIKKLEIIVGTLDEIKKYYSEILGTAEERKHLTQPDKIGYHLLDVDKFNSELKIFRDKQAGMGRVFYFKYKNKVTGEVSMELINDYVDIRQDP